MSATKERAWKILAMGRGQATAEKAEKHLHGIGFKNAKVIGLDNDKANDDKLIQLLKDHEWDAVSIGRYCARSDESIVRRLFKVVASMGSIPSFPRK